ncbi:hypothetical protein [Pyrobaculum islandicum]|nr:hypothetical protein [Pyrobaculum islandicum]
MYIPLWVEASRLDPRGTSSTHPRCGGLVRGSAPRSLLYRRCGWERGGT